MMVTGLQLPFQASPLDGLFTKSAMKDSETTQAVSFGEILRAKEKQLQQEQEINASLAAVAWAAMQTSSAVVPMLDLSTKEEFYKADIHPTVEKGLPLQTASHPSSEAVATRAENVSDHTITLEKTEPLVSTEIEQQAISLETGKAVVDNRRMEVSEIGHLPADDSTAILQSSNGKSSASSHDLAPETQSIENQAVFPVSKTKVPLSRQLNHSRTAQDGIDQEEVNVRTKIVEEQVSATASASAQVQPGAHGQMPTRVVQNSLLDQVDTDLRTVEHRMSGADTPVVLNHPLETYHDRGTANIRQQIFSETVSDQKQVEQTNIHVDMEAASSVNGERPQIERTPQYLFDEAPELSVNSAMPDPDSRAKQNVPSTQGFNVPSFFVNNSVVLPVEVQQNDVTTEMKASETVIPSSSNIKTNIAYKAESASSESGFQTKASAETSVSALSNDLPLSDGINQKDRLIDSPKDEKQVATDNSTVETFQRAVDVQKSTIHLSADTQIRNEPTNAGPAHSGTPELSLSELNNVLGRTEATYGEIQATANNSMLQSEEPDLRFTQVQPEIKRPVIDIPVETEEAKAQAVVHARKTTISVDQPEFDPIYAEPKEIKRQRIASEMEIVSLQFIEALEAGTSKLSMDAKENLYQSPVQGEETSPQSDVWRYQNTESQTKISFENGKMETRPAAIDTPIDVPQTASASSRGALPDTGADNQMEYVRRQAVIPEASSATVRSDLPAESNAKWPQAVSGKVAFETSQPLPDHQVIFSAPVSDGEMVAQRPAQPPSAGESEDVSLQTFDQTAHSVQSDTREANLLHLEVDVEKRVAHSEIGEQYIETGESVRATQHVSNISAVSSEEVTPPEVNPVKVSTVAQVKLSDDVTLSSSKTTNLHVGVDSETHPTSSHGAEKQAHSSPVAASQTMVKQDEKPEAPNTTNFALETSEQRLASANSRQKPEDRRTASPHESGIVTGKEPIANQEAHVSARPVSSMKFDSSTQDPKISLSGQSDEKVLFVEQHESNEKIETASTATNSTKEPIVMGPVEKSSTIQVNPHAVEVVQQVIRQLHGKLKSGPTSMHLQLNPESLGAIDVEVVKDVEGVSVTFFAEQSSTGKLLETQLSQLRQSLVDSGVQLSSLNIGQHNHSGQEGGFSHQNTEFAQRARQEDFQKKNDLKESPRAGQVTGQTSEVDYLI